MDPAASRCSRLFFFPSMWPVLMIAVSYVDLGKWLATVEAGARFGYELVFPMILFNSSAILCQYLAACTSMVTGKNLAELCREEYSQPSCFLLGFQANLSIWTTELTMILGIAHGFNLLFGIDLLVCIFFAVAAANIMPYIMRSVDKKLHETLMASVAGFSLICYVLGLLVSQPEIPLVTNVIFPKLSGESAYSLMALLGANVMAHNFYTHSSFVQDKRRCGVVSYGALCQDHLFSILFIFTGIFLVAYVLINTAAAVSFSAELLLNFQDVVLLLDQIFARPLAPLVFLMVLVFSGQIISLTCDFGGQLILQSLFGVRLAPPHVLILNSVLAVLPAIYYAKVFGAEGLYQLLISCQVIQAMLLPSSVIPLFRIASSRALMGAYRISWYLEISTFFAFLVMLFVNIAFVAEMLLGDSSWMNALKGETGTPVVIPYRVLLFISFVSIAFALYLAVTPLKSSSFGTDSMVWMPHFQRDLLGSLKANCKDAVEVAPCNSQGSADSVVQETSDHCLDKSALEFRETYDPAFGSNLCMQKRAVDISDLSQSLPDSVMEDIQSNVEDEGAAQMTEITSSVEKAAKEELDTSLHGETDELSGAGNNNSHEVDLAFSTSDGPSSIHLTGSFDAESTVKQTGLGRAARKQFATILEEFWAHLFDYHGKIVKEASKKKLDVLLGIDSGAASSSSRTDSQTTESLGNPLSAPSNTSRDRQSPNQVVPNQDLAYGLQMGTSSWSPNMQLPRMMQQSLGSNQIEQNGKSFPDYNLPTTSDSEYCQPATIHGYQLASYLKGLNASRNPYSNVLLDSQSFSSASVSPYYGEPATYARGDNLSGALGGSDLQSETVSRLNRLLTDRSRYDLSSINGSENVDGGSYSKKYHSSPDVSALIAASRNSLLYDGSSYGPVGTSSTLSRMASDRAQYTDLLSRSRVPAVAFSEGAAPQLHRDAYSSQLNLNPYSKSLWSRQPFEQILPMRGTDVKNADSLASQRSFVIPLQKLSGITNDGFSYAELEAELLQFLKLCIGKLLKLEGSGWLFQQNGGFDEELIDQVAAKEKLSQEAALENQGSDVLTVHGLPSCGDDCIWRASLVVSFGVWCIHRVLDLSLAESRPELWGKYTYVLNRLQGILDLAFKKPRHALGACACLQAAEYARTGKGPLSGSRGRPITGPITTASMILDMIKDVETSLSGRKGRTGTAAGDVAFPKGKENLSSVLKRYKRRLSGKAAAGL